MQEHPLLAAFLQLVGDFFFVSDTVSPLREPLLRRLAQVLLQGQVPATTRDAFQFERIQHFTTQYLTTDDRAVINTILLEEQQALLPPKPSIRGFLREMPTRTAHLRSSIPNWARSAALLNSVGPVQNRDGRRFWLDVYAVPTAVEVRLNATNQRVLYLAPDVPLVLHSAVVSSLVIGEGTL
ncbi:MAG: hypothetical protein LH618_03875, partial [Saprospiraceae bacterium]|nr:hypothetical protein [Saprospiraceae bacterium]